MAATQCVSCAKVIEGMDVYLRPGDGCNVCAKCYAYADRRCLQPPDTGGPGLVPTGKSNTAGQLGASLLIDVVLGIISD